MIEYINLPHELPFVGVVWSDASGNANIEYTIEEAQQGHKAVEYFTLGFKVVDDAKGITLFSEQCLVDGGLRGRSFIPKGMVEKVVEGEELARLLGLKAAKKARVKKQPAKPLEESL